MEPLQVQQISTATFICILISIVICIALPIALVILFKIKTKAKLVPLWIGAAIFFVFAMILEQICHAFLLGNNAVGEFIKASPFIYALYGGLAAGIFEETGRFVAFKFFLKKYNSKENALMYGVGHGGIEAIIISGVSMLSTLYLALILNKMGMDSYLSTLPEAVANQIKPSLETIYTTSPLLFLLSGFERIIAITYHISASVLVFFAVTKKEFRFLYPIAILLHTLINIPAGLYQRGIITNNFALEGGLFIYVAILAYFTYRLYHKVGNMDGKMVSLSDH
jgi:uncharacterized membrane protein YhfC